MKDLEQYHKLNAEIRRLGGSSKPLARLKVSMLSLERDAIWRRQPGSVRRGLRRGKLT